MLFQSWMLSLNKSWHHRDATCENGLIFEGTSSIKTRKNATPSFEGSKCLMFTNTSNSKSSVFCLDLMSCPCSFLYVNTNSTEVYFGLGFFEGVLMLVFSPSQRGPVGSCEGWVRKGLVCFFIARLLPILTHLMPGKIHQWTQKGYQAKSTGWTKPSPSKQQPALNFQNHLS